MVDAFARSIRSPSRQNNFATASLAQWVYHGCSCIRCGILAKGFRGYAAPSAILTARARSATSASKTTRSISRPSRSARSRERNARSDGMQISSMPGRRGVALMRSISCVTCRSNVSAGPKRSGRKANGTIRSESSRAAAACPVVCRASQAARAVLERAGSCQQAADRSRIDGSHISHAALELANEVLLRRGLGPDMH
jgi:hypothetical protein